MENSEGNVKRFEILEILEGDENYEVEFDVLQVQYTMELGKDWDAILISAFEEAGLTEDVLELVGGGTIIATGARDLEFWFTGDGAEFEDHESRAREVLKGLGFVEEVFVDEVFRGMATEASKRNHPSNG
jgi:hypothetical protein